MKALFILYVENQELSAKFYENTLGTKPILNVPGMTEFKLNDGSILGIMPEKGMKKLLGNTITCPSLANKTPRAELYLTVDEPEEYHQRALKAGAKELSSPSLRSWGDIAAYSSDLDGHILVFASTQS